MTFVTDKVFPLRQHMMQSMARKSTLHICKMVQVPMPRIILFEVSLAVIIQPVIVYMQQILVLIICYLLSLSVSDCSSYDECLYWFPFLAT